MATAYQIAGGNLRPRHAIAHKYGSALYVRLWHRNNDELSVWKSTDDGATWAQAGGVVYCGNGTTFNAGCGTASGSIIYVTYHHASSTPDSLRVARYDMATDDWISEWVGPDVPFSQWNQCGVRSDGSLVIIYMHTEADPGSPGNFRRKWRYVTCTSGGTFGTEADLSTAWQTWSNTQLDTQYGPVIIDASDTAHFFYMQSTSGSSNLDNELMYRSLTAGGTLSSEVAALSVDAEVSTARGGTRLSIAGTESTVYAITDVTGLAFAPTMIHGAVSAVPGSYTVHPSIATTQQGVTTIGTTAYGTWPLSQSGSTLTGVQIGRFTGSWGTTDTVNDGTGGEPTWVWWMISPLGTDALGFVLEDWTTELPWFMRYPIGVGPAARYYAM